MGDIPGWYYYKQALLPVGPPHGEADTALIESGEIWKGHYKNAFFARWTSDFDCGRETNWWYVIKPEPFDIAALNSKKRYKINRGLRYFDVRQIDPMEYLEDIYRIQTLAYQAYPEKYRPTVEREKLFETVSEEWTKPGAAVFMAFHRESGMPEGYIHMQVEDTCIYSIAQKAVPAYEKFHINHAMLAGVLDYWKEELGNGKYFCVGARNIQHETAFMDFVEENFGFRKAYCRLNISYNPRVKWLVTVLYSVRGILKKLDGIGIVHKINGVMQMEEIVRNQAER